MSINQRKGAALKDRRLLQRLDLADVSESIGVPERFVDAIEKGKSLPVYSHLLVLEKYHKYLCDLEGAVERGSDTCEPDSASRPAHFTVEAGRYDDDGENCKYCNDFSELSAAMAAFDYTKGYQWRRIVYFAENGNTGVDITHGFDNRQIIYQLNVETKLFDRIG